MIHESRLTDDQKVQLIEAYEDPDTVLCYWCSDAWGRSANGGLLNEEWHAKPGAIQRISEDRIIRACPAGTTEGGLHGTLDPHKWAGQRVWLVALHGEVQECPTKFAARNREIICEIRPDDLLSPQIAARVGVQIDRLQGADLRHANLRHANLRNADLRHANLCETDLRHANLRYADLRHANLRHADLRAADLRGADLRRAGLYNADLRGADLRNADLRRADLRAADLYEADLRHANLRNADLRNADLRRADLRAADLCGADLDGADLPTNFTPPAKARV